MPARAASLFYGFPFSGFVQSDVETGLAISSPTPVTSIVGQAFSDSFFIAEANSGISHFGSSATTLSGFIKPVFAPGFPGSPYNTGLSYLSGSNASGSIGSLAFIHDVSNQRRFNGGHPDPKCGASRSSCSCASNAADHRCVTLPLFNSASASLASVHFCFGGSRLHRLTITNIGSSNAEHRLEPTRHGPPAGARLGRRSASCSVGFLTGFGTKSGARASATLLRPE